MVKMVFLASGDLESEKDIRHVPTVARDPHRKQEKSYSPIRNSGGCQDPPEVSRKLSAGILTNWLN